MTETEDLQLQWARESLARDGLYSRMPEKEQLRIIDEAIQFGVHIAEKTREKLGTPKGADSIREMESPYGKGDASRAIVETISHAKFRQKVRPGDELREQMRPGEGGDDGE